MGKPKRRTVENTSTANASGDGRDNLGSLHVPLSPVHSAQMEQLSMKKRKAFG